MKSSGKDSSDRSKSRSLLKPKTVPLVSPMSLQRRKEKIDHGSPLEEFEQDLYNRMMNDDRDNDEYDKENERPNVRNRRTKDSRNQSSKSDLEKL